MPLPMNPLQAAQKHTRWNPGQLVCAQINVFEFELAFIQNNLTQYIVIFLHKYAYI
jgi:hypothetical protein